MIRKILLTVSFSVLLCKPISLLAQIETEKATSQERLHTFFFEALKQKGIENYDKAIASLEQCVELEPENATFYFELGKNYLSLKNYNNAYNSFERATQIDPTNKWFWIGMYDVNYATKDYNRGIAVLNELINFDPKFKEDLVSLYMQTKQFDKALALINELNETTGKSDRRELYKMQILSQGSFRNNEIENLIEQIKKSPKEEANYINLIHLYSKENQVDKVLETAHQLELALPNSEWAQVSLFKFYLESKEVDKAIKAMDVVLASTKIDSKIKHRVLNEFLIFTNANTQYIPNLDKAIGYFNNDPEVNVPTEVAKFFHSKQKNDLAIKYYELGIAKSKKVDLETNLLLIQGYTDTKNFDAVLKKSLDLIDVFPNMPQLYYFAGLAYNQKGQFKKSKDILEMGIDFVIENPPLEINFNIQLGEAFNGLGDMAKKELYFSKANRLLKK